MKTVADYNFSGKKALVRVDFNVPLDSNRKVSDDTRIRESIPTLKKILDDNGSVIIMSHLGRPKGGFEEKYSLEPVVEVLKKYLAVEVVFIKEMLNDKVKEAAKNLKPGQVMLLENLRFHPEEEKPTEEFAKQLASLGDCYVNDAFATAHRAHCSTYTVSKFFPNDKMFGFLLANEVKMLDKVLHNADAPFTAVIGGAKVSSKLSVLKNILKKADNIIIGGGMAFTFTKALGGKVGKSLVEDDMLGEAMEILKLAALKGVNIYLPIDAVIANDFNNEAATDVVAADEIPDGWMGLDLGPKSIRKFAEVIKNSRTILWNGPMGVFEMSNFQHGTRATGIAIAASTLAGSFSLAGGGDSVAAINQFQLASFFSYVSTGGGAMLEYMEGIDLPGVKALKE